jgi:hypothetical protein
MSSGLPSFTFKGHSGSAHKGRPSAMKSPLPSARMLSAKSGLVIDPDAMTDSETSFLMASAAQVLCASDIPMGLTSWMVVWWLPPDTWIAATPSASRRLQSSMLSSIVVPPSS